MATSGDAHIATKDRHGTRAPQRFGAAGLSAAGAVAAPEISRVAGRYRLEDLMSDTGQSTVWKAVDDVLARPVTIRTFSSGSGRAGDVVAAACAASRVSDPRLERVFDADAAAGSGYIVTEWPAGEYLEDMIAAGGLDVALATRIIAEAAGAVAAAHAAGIPHLCLTPRSLRWSAEAGLTIIGLGVEAVLTQQALPPHEIADTGALSDAWALADTRALARLLYASLTGHWPGAGHPVLPAAPQRDGRPYRPRQVRAGVPARIDEITCRALFDPAPGDEPSLTSPAEFADLIHAAREHDRGEHSRAAVRNETAARGEFTPSEISTSVWPPRRRRRHTLASGLVGALFVIDSALIGASIIGASHAPHIAATVAQTPRAAPQPKPPAHTIHSMTLRPVSARAFDPYAAGEDENNELAPAAIDGSLATAWHTFWYTTQRFGNLTPGTGLLLDLGHPRMIQTVRVMLGAVAGADVELRIGDEASLHGLPVVAAADGAGGSVSLRPARPHRGRYVLIWFTRLPPAEDGGGVFQADVYDVSVHGF